VSEACRRAAFADMNADPEFSRDLWSIRRARAITPPLDLPDPAPRLARVLPTEAVCYMGPGNRSRQYAERYWGISYAASCRRAFYS
jgi:hypothetical protein